MAMDREKLSDRARSINQWLSLGYNACRLITWLGVPGLMGAWFYSLREYWPLAPLAVVMAAPCVIWSWNGVIWCLGQENATIQLWQVRRDLKRLIKSGQQIGGSAKAQAETWKTAVVAYLRHAFIDPRYASAFQGETNGLDGGRLVTAGIACLHAIRRKVSYRDLTMGSLAATPLGPTPDPSPPPPSRA